MNIFNNMSEESLRRMALKQQLYRNRVTWTERGWVPVCAICGKVQGDGFMEMHEAILSRGDVQGMGLDTEYVMNECNCVLVHRGCHIHANSKEATKSCIRHLLKFNGLEDILYWLRAVDERANSSLCKERIRLVKEVYDELQDMWKANN